MPGDRGGLTQRADELGADVIDLDRRKTQAAEPRRRAGFPHEPGERVAALTVPEATEVDPREDDLAMPLADASAHLAEHGVRASAAGAPTHERDHAEVAREAAAVLHADEGAHPIEARVRLHAADRTDVAGDESGSLLAATGDDRDVLGQPGEAVLG